MSCATPRYALLPNPAALALRWQAEKAAAQVDTQPLLDALDKAYDEPCEVRLC